MRKALCILILALVPILAQATTAGLIPSPKMQFFATTGAPLVGGKVYFYVTGTTTPTNTYTDSAAGTPNANPVILDSRGEADIWLDPTVTYRVVLKTSLDVTLWTKDGITAGAAGVGYVQTGSGAVRQSVQDGLRQRMSTIKEFGAACDGSTADDAAFALVIVLQRSVIIPKSTGACRVSGNLTFPATMQVVFERGGQITVDSAKTLTIPYVSAPDSQVFTGSGVVALTRVPEINPNWFGADGSGNTSSSTAIQKAIDAAQDSLTRATVRFTCGTYAMDATANLIQTNSGISIAGPPEAAMRDGSGDVCVLLKWTGGALPMFTLGEGPSTPTSYVNFYNFAVENFGSATMWLNIQLGGHMQIRRVSFQANSPTSNPFSIAVIRAKSNVVGDGGGLNYSTIEQSEFNYAAPVIFKYDNQSASNSFTWLHFDNNVVNANADMTVFEFTNGGGKLLRIQGNTFNSQVAIGSAYVFNVVDMTSIGSFFLDNFIFRDNEYDDGVVGGTSSANKMLKLRRVRNGEISNTNIVGNSDATSYITIIDSDHIVVTNTRAASYLGPLVETMDATSRVFFGPNSLNTSNTALLVNNSTAGSGAVDITATGANLIIEGHKGLPSGHTVYQWSTPNNSNYTVTLAKPGDAVPSYITRGQIVTVLIRNTLGGAMGTISFSADYKTSGAFTSPATGTSRAITFYYNGGAMVEIGRGAADVTMWYDPREFVPEQMRDFLAANDERYRSAA